MEMVLSNRAFEKSRMKYKFLRGLDLSRNLLTHGKGIKESKGGKPGRQFFSLGIKKVFILYLI